MFDRSRGRGFKKVYNTLQEDEQKALSRPTEKKNV